MVRFRATPIPQLTACVSIENEATQLHGLYSVAAPAPASFSLSKELIFVTSSGRETKSSSYFFASITGAVSSGLRQASLRRTFNAIDHDSKGHINEQDLTLYARANGLPVSYVKSFVSAVLQQSGSKQTDSTGAAAPVTFEAFQAFVGSRERALRQAFDLFDRDKDGRISIADLDASLAHVAVCCPKTRCVYRCRRRLVGDLLRTVDLGSSRTLAFWQFRQFFMLLPQREMVVEYWLSAAEAAGTCCEVDNRILLHTSASRGAPWGHLVAGAAAGAASRTVTAPLETLRLAAMAGTLGTSNLLVAAQHMVADGGWGCLYRGNLVNVLRSAPQKALDFFAFDLFKRKLGDDTPANTLVAAGLAGTASWLTLYPLEVLRSRMTVEPCSSARPPLVLLRAIVAAEGWRALYKGLGPSLAAIFPEAAITYGLHDLLKSSYRRLHNNSEPGVMPSLMFGVLAAFMGQTVAYPLETISRRLQVQGAGASGGAAGVVKQLMREGGPRAFYRGIGAATVRLVPMALVSFGTYEVVRALLLKAEAAQLQRQAQQDAQQRQQGLLSAQQVLQVQQVQALLQQVQSCEEEEQWCEWREAVEPPERQWSQLEASAQPLQAS